MTLFKRALMIVFSVSLTALAMTNVQAAVVSNQQIIQKAYQLENKQSLLQNIKREDVQQQLLSMGVSAEDAESRINQMTHEEIAQLNQHMAEMPAGAGGVGTVVFIFLVFVVTDVIGATDIFPFIKPIN